MTKIELFNYLASRQNNFKLRCGVSLSHYLHGFLLAEEDFKYSEERAVLQSRLDDTSQMLNRLKQVQHERLSAPPPAHLSNVSKAGEAEVMLAEKITDNLTDIAKKLPPSGIAPVDGLRRAMGIAPLGGPEPMEVEPITHNPTIVADTSLLPPNANNGNNQVLSNLLPTSPIPSTNLLSPTGQQNQNMSIVGAPPPSIQPPPPSIQMQMGLTHSSQTPPSLLSATEPSGVTDLESELREFLESDPTLGHSPLHDDKTLEDILSES